jgi:predicted Fe-S protein YdhL (DUF1289 family)
VKSKAAFAARTSPSSMFSWKSPPPKPILTPCIGVCELDAAGLCKGCHRTVDEIARWASMSDGERARLMSEVLPQREPSPAA